MHFKQLETYNNINAYDKEEQMPYNAFLSEICQSKVIWLYDVIMT